MDKTDHKIIALLRRNGRMPIKDIAAAVGLTSPAVSGRIGKLEAAGIIVGYTVLLQPPKSQGQVESLISIAVQPDRVDEFMAYLDATPEVLQCFHITGAFSHTLRACCADISRLERLIGSLQKFGATNSQIILSTPIERPADLL